MRIVILAKYTVDFVLMLVIFFIAARMHALQIDPKHDSPQRWVQAYFYDCTDSVAGQMLLVLIMPFDRECECKKVLTEDDAVYVEKDKTDEMAITAIQRLGLLARYGDFSAVMAFVFDITHPIGASSTPPSRPPCSAS